MVGSALDCRLRLTLSSAVSTTGLMGLLVLPELALERRDLEDLLVKLKPRRCLLVAAAAAGRVAVAVVDMVPVQSSSRENLYQRREESNNPSSLVSDSLGQGKGKRTPVTRFNLRLAVGNLRMQHDARWIKLKNSPRCRRVWSADN